MARYLRIVCCGECPHFHATGMVCMMVSSETRIYRDTYCPAWCPLPPAPEPERKKPT